MKKLITLFRKIFLKYRNHYKCSGILGIIRLSFAIVFLLFRRIIAFLPLHSKNCPCCGWRGCTFLPFIDGGYVTFHAVCPKCNSHARHRGHCIFYERVLGMQHANGNLLYFAPDPPIQFLRSNPDLNITTSNYQGEGADINLDIMNTQFPDYTWDFIICHRVLEHVSDDIKAIYELHRILKVSGVAIISVPIDRSIETTIKYLQPNIFESDHYYSYGRDFKDRLAMSFDVAEYHFSDIFSKREFKEMALHEDDIFVCKYRLT